MDVGDVKESTNIQQNLSGWHVSHVVDIHQSDFMDGKFNQAIGGWKFLAM